MITVILVYKGHQDDNVKPNVTVIGGIAHNVGEVSKAEAIEHQFVIVNPNPFAIGVSIPTTGCTCTHARVSTDVMAPHGAAIITVNVEPEGAGDLSAGVCIATTHCQQRLETWLLLTGHVHNKQQNPPKRSKLQQVIKLPK